MRDGGDRRAINGRQTFTFSDFSTSPGSGNRCSASFEKTSLPSIFTSKRPPSPGTSVIAVSLRFNAPSSSAVRPTAFGS